MCGATTNITDLAGSGGPPQLLATAAILLACGFALWAGGRIERLVAAAALISHFGPRLVVAGSPDSAALTIDAALLLGLVGLALRCRPSWMLFAAAFQLLIVLTRAASVMATPPAWWPSALALQVWTYGLLTALLVGSWNAWRTRARSTASDRPDPSSPAR